MELSGAVKLRNVSDYIAPNQACVVSLRGGKLSADDEEARVAAACASAPTPRAAPPTPPCADARAAQAGLVQPRPRGAAAGGVALPPLPQAIAPVKVTLHDCLACRRVVTPVASYSTARV